MNQYFIVCFILFIVIHNTSGECHTPPSIKHIPHNCCRYGKLIDEDLKNECKKKNPGNDNSPHVGQGQQPVGRCYMECIFNETGMYVNEQIDPVRVMSVFLSNVNNNTEITTISTSGIQKCLKNVMSRVKEFSDAVLSRASYCNPITWSLFVCVKAYILTNCPNQYFKSTDPDCVEIKNYIATCVVYE